MKSLILGAVAIIGMTSAAQAELAGGEVKLSYGMIDFDGLNSFSDFAASGAFDFQVSRSFGFQAGAAYESVGYSEDGYDLDLSATSFDLHGYYQIETFRAGLFVGRGELGALTFEGESEDIDLGTTNYGLDMQISNGKTTVGGFYGISDVDDFSEVSTTFFGLNATFAVGDALAVGGEYNFVESSVDGVDETSSTSNFLIGADYQLEQWVNAPVVISGYLGKMTLSDGDLDEDGTTYGASISYLFGADTSNNRRRLLQTFVSPF